MNLRNWIVFGLLSAVWGASFLWIGIALDEKITPMTLATVRVGLGLSGLLLVVRLKNVALPREPRVWALFIATGILNTALPFPLISWAETRIDTGMASVLNGTVPLFTNVFAHFLFHDERMSLRRAFGLLCGFAGLLVLASKAFGQGERLTTLPGILAMLGAVFCYAAANCYAKKFLRGQRPIITATMTLLIAFIIMLPALLITEHPVKWPVLPLTWIALSWLGFLGLSWAYVAYFDLIEQWGPSRVSTSAYLYPFVGMLLGIVFRHEAPTWRLYVGAAMIVLGLWIVNLRISKVPEKSAVPN